MNKYLTNIFFNKIFNPVFFLSLSISFLTLSYFIAWGWQEQIVYILFPLAFILNLRDQVKVFPKFTLNLGLIIFLIILISASSLWSDAPGKYLMTSLRYGGTILFSLMIFFWYFGKSDFNEKLKKLIIAIVITSTIIVLLSLIINPYTAGVDRLTHFSFTGITKNPNNSGLYIGVSSLFVIYFLRKTNNLKMFFLLSITLCIHLIFLILTKSRGAISFFVICYAIQIYTTNANTLKQELLINITIIFISIVFFVLFSSIIENRINEPYYRIELLKHALVIIKNNFWFGDGLNYDFKINFSDGNSYSKIHNSFFQVFQNSGFFGFLALILLCFRVICSSLRNSNDYVKLTGLWLIFGALYMSVDAGMIITRPSKIWFNFWIPALILLAIEFYEKRIR